MFAGPGLVAAAINHGYRLIDTAEFYHNEEGVGAGLKQSGQKREDVFVVSKWWPSREGAPGALKTLERCLKGFVAPSPLLSFHSSVSLTVCNQRTSICTSYMHHKGGIAPKLIAHCSTQKSKGRSSAKMLTLDVSSHAHCACCRSLGVSNFGVAHLKALAKLGLDKPSVNQIELHPWQQKKDIVKYCRENDIAVMGYSPLAKGQKVQDKTVVGIARK